jgi:hypothetical protein
MDDRQKTKGGKICNELAWQDNLGVFAMFPDNTWHITFLKKRTKWANVTSVEKKYRLRTTQHSSKQS